MEEAGGPGSEANAWYGLEAPNGTPASVLAKLHSHVVNYLRSPDVQKRCADMGVNPVGNTRAEFGAQIPRELAKWRQVIQQAGIKIE